MVDYEVCFVVQNVGQEGRHVVAAKVEEEAFECETWHCLEEVHGDKAGKMAAGGLEIVSTSNSNIARMRRENDGRGDLPHRR